MFPKLKIKLGPQAVLPQRGTAFSTGCDLTIVSVDKNFTFLTTLYDTQISVQPPDGYYVEVVPRSSLSKSGYMMANSLGVIDNDYRGTLKIALTKVDASAPDLQLPFTCGQMILRKLELYELETVEELTDTARGAGGFGSTDKKVEKLEEVVWHRADIVKEWEKDNKSPLNLKVEDLSWPPKSKEEYDRVCAQTDNFQTLPKLVAEWEENFIKNNPEAKKEKFWDTDDSKAE